MKTASILLFLTALVSATPHANPPGAVAAALESRQADCVYAVLCQLDRDDTAADPDTAKCCGEAGGTVEQNGYVRQHSYPQN